MEGTRHEKIAIIIASYVIGFTTAFIAFGINQPDSRMQVQIQGGQNNSAQQVSDNDITSVGYGNDGLFVITSGYERLLSAKASTLGASAISSKGTSGYYYKIVDAEASRDGRFVYFCEQLTQDAETCDPYVYAVEDDSLHMVKADGSAYKSPVATHESAWSDDNDLVLNSMSSAVKDTPWLLSTPETPVETSVEEGNEPQVQ